MRRWKWFVAAYLLLLFVAGVLYVVWPPVPEVRLGMTYEEVNRRLGVGQFTEGGEETEWFYYPRTDVFGVHHPVWVGYRNERVANIETAGPFYRRPVWLDGLPMPFGW